MNRPDKRPPEEGPPGLAAASAALEAELRRFEELSNAACKVPLDSQKNIERASRLTREAAESQERFGTHLRALVDAVASARDRQQANADALQVRVAEIQQRSGRYELLLQRFAGLGKRAAAIQEKVQQAAAMKRDEEAPGAFAEVVSVIEQVQVDMADVAEEAADLTRTAAGEGLLDLARQADSLRQQVLSVRNRINLLHRGLKSSN